MVTDLLWNTYIEPSAVACEPHNPHDESSIRIHLPHDRTRFNDSLRLPSGPVRYHDKPHAVCQNNIKYLGPSEPFPQSHRLQSQSILSFFITLNNAVLQIYHSLRPGFRHLRRRRSHQRGFGRSPPAMQASSHVLRRKLRVLRRSLRCRRKRFQLSYLFL